MLLCVADQIKNGDNNSLRYLISLLHLYSLETQHLYRKAVLVLQINKGWKNVYEQTITDIRSSKGWHTILQMVH